ncbi:MAG TPA: hypothetical protein VK966_07715, partial [Longimicrobiales bacterium]|nr:hypothetical protein [Longimicrobiales bacterium]
MLIVGIALISLNLRPALASVGPVAGLIASDTGLSHAAVGLLTTIPLLAFGVVSTLTPYLTGRLGFGGTMTLGLALLAGGTALRAAPAVSLLYGGT